MTSYATKPLQFRCFSRMKILRFSALWILPIADVLRRVYWSRAETKPKTKIYDRTNFEPQHMCLRSILIALCISNDWKYEPRVDWIRVENIKKYLNRMKVKPVPKATSEPYKAVVLLWMLTFWFHYLVTISDLFFLFVKHWNISKVCFSIDHKNMRTFNSLAAAVS